MVQKNNLEVDFGEVYDPFLLKIKSFHDHRGDFIKLFQEPEICFEIKQVNFSISNIRGSVRGIHSNSEFNEVKIVFCLEGEIYDVAVDLRENSQNRGKCFSRILKPDSGGFVIPKGYGHGYQVLSNGAKLLYLHNQRYEPKNEQVISVYSSKIDFAWPLPIANLSERDQNAPDFV